MRLQMRHLVGVVRAARDQRAAEQPSTHWPNRRVPRVSGFSGPSEDGVLQILRLIRLQRPDLTTRARSVRRNSG